MSLAAPMTRSAPTRATERTGPTNAAPRVGSRAAPCPQAALATWYAKDFHRMYAIARALTRRDEAFCLDVVQDATLRAARRALPIPDSPAWAASLVRRAAIDRLRAEQRRARREHAVAQSRNRSAPIHAPDHYAADALRDALADLPPAERDLIVQRIARDRTLRQLAEADAPRAQPIAAGDPPPSSPRSQVTPDAVHGRVRRALARLRERLEDQ